MAGIEQLKGSLISKNGMAMANTYSVEMPTQVGVAVDGGTVTKLTGMSAKTANILCKSVNMPGKQILTLDRQMGIFNEKVVNGFAVEDVSMTFYALNDYGVKKYFDSWCRAMVGEHVVPPPPPPAEKKEGKGKTAADVKEEEEKIKAKPLAEGSVGYKDNYVAPIKIHQLRKPIMRVGFDLGPLSIDFDLLGASIYSIVLEDAFPTTMSTIELSNDGQLVECTIQFSYTKWKVIKDERGLGDITLSLGSIF
jgi:hypothetical protein|tara:strand:- start:1440 stop:2192 length:753 start_codon:yes stop_codon:yes gene_type:complete